MRVLAVDDDTVSLRILEHILSRDGYIVVTARDGEEAWDYIQASTQDFVAVLDWLMPGISGIEICRKVQAISDGVTPYIIMLTSKDDRNDAVEALDAGANDFIQKPFKPAELSARVRAGVRVLQLQMALQQKIVEARTATTRVRTLQGLIRICSHCHNICNDEETWEHMENYIERHSDASFSHGVCPQCRESIHR